MINWTHAALLPAARRIAQYIQQEWGLWVGIASATGEIIPFPGAANIGPRPICERFMANRSAEGPVRTCAASVRSWVDSDEHKPKTCHIGLNAISVPIQHRGHTLAVVYASGFLPAEDAGPNVESITRAWSQAGYDNANLDHWIDDLPRLDRKKRDVVHGLLRAIVHEIQASEDQIMAASPDLDRYGDMVGKSEAMLKLFHMLRRVSTSNSTVLIQGENGTGKELIARALHKTSARNEQAFIVQNVAAIPAELIESELFGHRKGAFSGAHRDRVGLFEMANHGTFFLDEIGEMTLSLQVKLLRVLQEGTFLPVGDNAFRKVNVRVLCATNRELKEEVKKGNFREDLFYRINVVTITAPPLRNRREDIPLLAEHFIASAALRHDLPPKKLAPSTLARLMEHAWPGNVRELENELEKLVILSGDAPIIEDTYVSFGSRPKNDLGNLHTGNMSMPEAVETLERHMILESLKRTNWNKSQTARELGVSRRNLIRKVADFGLDDDR